MPEMIHVLIQDHHYTLEDWLAATDRQSVTCCRYYRPMTSSERQICLGVRGQHCTRHEMCGAALECSRILQVNEGIVDWYELKSLCRPIVIIILYTFLATRWRPLWTRSNKWVL